MDKPEIDEKYLKQHNALGTRKAAVDKELFDQQHQKVWADCEAELKVRKGELESKTELTEKEGEELVELKSLLP